MFGAPFWKLASFPESESWSGAKSEAKLRKSTKYPGGRRVISRYTRVLRKIPGILPIWPKIWLILGPNQPQTRLRAQNLTISTEFSRENREEKRGCCREKRKGKETGCERKSIYSLICAQTELVAQADACAVLRTWFSRRGRPRGETSREHSRQGPQGRVPRDHTALSCSLVDSLVPPRCPVHPTHGVS